MLERGKNPETIIERKKREYLESIKAKEEAPLKQKFRAQPIPDSSKTPMFDNIIMG